MEHLLPACKAFNIHNDQITFAILGQVDRCLGFAAKLRNFNAAEYILASSPVVSLPGCFTIIDKKYNRPYLIEKE